MRKPIVIMLALSALLVAIFALPALADITEGNLKENTLIETSGDDVLHGKVLLRAQRPDSEVEPLRAVCAQIESLRRPGSEVEPMRAICAQIESLRRPGSEVEPL